MIERMNNVEHRTLASPQYKRRKLEPEEGFGLKPSFGTGGGGMMGQYIQEKKEESKRAGSTQVEMVDLTSGSRSSVSNLVRTSLTYLQMMTAMLLKYNHQ